MRRPLVGGNWKMNLLSAEARDYVARLGQLSVGQAEVVLFPSFPLLTTLARGLAGSPVALGGQDLHPGAKGAHTGDVSGPQLVDAGCQWVLCGHSERRQDHHESDALVAAKVAAAIEHGLTPLICVGETQEERQAEETFAILERQLRAALPSARDRFELAYEPVWAIGTGATATPEIAQEAHAFLRRTLAEVMGEAIAARCRILYGGSANPDNAADLIAQPDLDGFLVGGASLDPDKFLTIIRACGWS
ncbi:MAG: triose-phosphate isomerase [Acidobacteria bacterium]|nr:triose-phosphate isomerase [Acidobacteriota bacterium]